MSSEKIDDITAKTGFTELTEALTTGLLRAVAACDAQSPQKNPKFPIGRITLGLIYDSGRNDQEATSSPTPITGVAARFPKELIRAGEGELSEESLLRVNKKLRAYPKASSELVASFFADYPNVMAMLFDLNDEQKESMWTDACENRERLQSISRAANAILEAGEDIILDFRLTDEAKADARKKFCVQSFTLGASGSIQGGASGVGGGGTLSGSITVGLCKK